MITLLELRDLVQAGAQPIVRILRDDFFYEETFFNSEGMVR